MHCNQFSRIARLSLVAATVSLLGLSALPASAAVTFLGVASGDASSTGATFWTRALDSTAPANTALTLQITTDPTFATISNTFNCTTDSTKDYVCKLDITGLTANTVYYYRFIGPASEQSLVGRVKTAPDASASTPLHFAFSGDADGLIRPYALSSRIPEKQLDFFMWDGDTEYETSASIGSPAVTSTGNIPDPTATTPTATATQLFTDFSRKYRENFIPVNAGGQNGLQAFFTGQGNYTTYDNHELGNKQYINGGAPAGGPVGSTTGSAPFDFPSGAGVDARVSTNDVNTSGTFLNKTGGFLTMQQVFLNYQPIKDRGTISAPSDPNTNGTKQIYFAQQWGKNAIFINTDSRSYRDIRMKTSSNADDTGSRADNTLRTYLGATQLAWLEQTLLAAQQAGTPWKFVNMSDPIDQIGPIGGSLTLTGSPSAAQYGLLGNVTALTTSAASSGTGFKTVTVPSTVGVVVGQPVSGTGVTSGSKVASINTNGMQFTLDLTQSAAIPSGTALTLSGATSGYSPVSSDGGKAWVGGYRAERNALLKFIADNHITNVVFLGADDHQNRINELLYSPSGRTGPGSAGFTQSDYVKVPYSFSIVAGPLGATGPDLISNHTFSLAKQLADSLANAETAAGIEPIGLGGYPGLRNVARIGDANADTLRQPADFYSPDTYNYNILDVSADGKTLTVTSKGINSTVQNSFLEYDSLNNPEQTIFSFSIDSAIDAVAAVPTNVTVTRGGFVLDRRTGTFTQQLTLTNTGTTTVSGTVAIALDSLSTNATLATSAGVTAATAPTGSPLAVVNVGSDSVLTPGETATVVLQFSNPTRAAITYNTRVLGGVTP